MTQPEARLVDTDVYSHLMKPGDKRGELCKPHLQNRVVAVSFVTVGELLFGAKKRKWGQDRLDDLNQRLRSTLIVPYDREVCNTYADLKAELSAKGKPIADNDLWIAACAVRHSIPLVSNNRSHFEQVPGLILISEAKIIQEIASQRKIEFPASSGPADSSSVPEPPSSQ